MIRHLGVISGVAMTQFDDGRVEFATDISNIDADGANGLSRHPQTNEPLFAYMPGDKGLDSLAGSAGFPGHPWWRDILVNTDDDPKIPWSTRMLHKGHIIVFNGGYHSKTAWMDKRRYWSDADRYLDACVVPYMVVPPQIRIRAQGVVLGCKARITYGPLAIECMVGDISGANSIGEMSIAAAEALTIDSSPRHGGTDKSVLYELWPGRPAFIKGQTFDLLPYEP